MSDDPESFWSLLDGCGFGFDTSDEDECLELYGETPVWIRDLSCAWECQSLVCNGGFFGYFESGSGMLAPEAAVGFDALGMKGISALIREAMAVLGDPFPRDYDTRQAAIGMGPFPQGFVIPKHLSAKESVAFVAKSDVMDQLERIKESFRPIEDKFFKLIEMEGGGFEKAANDYARQAQKGFVDGTNS